MTERPAWVSDHHRTRRRAAGADAALRVFGYENTVVCDASALPANPGVNPALTIPALAEHAMSHVPANGLGR